MALVHFCHFCHHSSLVSFAFIHAEEDTDIVHSIAQIYRMGISGLKLDDVLMVVVVVSQHKPSLGMGALANVWQLLYILLVVSLNHIAIGGGSNLFLPEELSTFSPYEIQERIKGSKIVVVSEQVRVTSSFSADDQSLHLTGNAQCHLCLKMVHSHLLRASYTGHYRPPSPGENGVILRCSRLHIYPSRLLHCMSTVSWLLVS
jgi:hypothetical protein